MTSECSISDQQHTRKGMTLIEMLVATTATLILMGIVAQLMGAIGNGVSDSRAALELSAQMRTVAHRLRTDLAGITVETVPPVAVDSDSGYLEIIEGSGTDTSLGLTQLTGDTDDVLMFTTRSIGRPFSGRFGNATTVIESPYAEVAWFCQPATDQPLASATPSSTLYNLYRRQLLVMNYAGAGSFQGSNANSILNTMPGAYADYDISLRRDSTLNRTLPNGLSDLTKRENRFLHNFPGTVSAAAFPYENTFLANLANDGPLSGSRVGEDIILTNVLAFDVRVFDPTAQVRNSSTGNVATIPGDPGYAAASPFSPTVQGAYIDIGVAGAGTFSAANLEPTSGLANLTYDTWSTHYEVNGIDEDGNGAVDQGTNGIDNGGLAGVVDDADEQETSPPYPYPLRGIEVRIRVYEPSSRQVRQVTVRHSFVPH